jgi:hypothetical protein
VKPFEWKKHMEYFKKVMITVFSALIAIPTIALGFYLTYEAVTALGN